MVLVVAAAVVLLVLPGDNTGEEDAGTSFADERESRENPPESGGGGQGLIPDEPCDAFSDEHLDELEADEPDQQPTAEGSTTCSWSVLYDNSITGYLDLSYTEPNSEAPGGASDAEENYDFHLDFLREGQEGLRDVDVTEETSLDLGDESQLVYAVEELDVMESPHAVVTTLIRDGDMNVEIALTTFDDESLVESEYTDELEDLMVDLGTDALDHLD